MVWVNCSATKSISVAAGGGGRRRDEVYVGAVPLRAIKGPSQLVMSAAYSLNLWDLQHFMVFIKPPSSAQEVIVFDFQPKDPEDIYVAISAMSGRCVPGVVQERNLTKLPTRKCWFVGNSKDDSINVARKFNEKWETDLRIGHHDCRDYTNGLVEYLTGEECVLEQLRRKHAI